MMDNLKNGMMEWHQINNKQYPKCVFVGKCTENEAVLAVKELSDIFCSDFAFKIFLASMRLSTITLTLR